jgi:hypothetical protein
VRTDLRALGESSLRCLQCPTLQGFKVTEDQMFTCLKGLGTLRSLSLRCIKLTDGGFKRILDYCTMEAAMEEMELDSLFGFLLVEPDVSESRMILFGPSWAVQPSLPISWSDQPAVHPDSRASFRRALGKKAAY